MSLPARWACAAALPPLLLAGMYIGFAVDVPLFDQWEWPLFLDKWHSGTLAPADFWAQHNEHRPLFPRLLLLALAAPSGWDIRLELALNFLLGIGIFGAALAAAALAARADARPLRPWWPAVAGVLLCSLVQWQNWFLGWQSQLLLAALAMHLGFLALQVPRARGTLPGVIAAGVLASFSFASGLLWWPLALLGIFAQPATGTRNRAAAAVALTAVLVGGIYFTGYTSPPHHPGLFSGLAHPVAAGMHALAGLGQPVAGWSLAASILAGALGGAAWIGIAAAALRPGAARTLRLAALWGAWSVLAAGLTALPRAAFGVEQALSSRYATFAVPLWLGLALALAATSRKGHAPVVAALALALCAAITSAYGAYRWTERHAVYTQARAALLAGGPVESLAWLYPETAVLLERRALLERRGWSVFRP
jgi:hypothetical protein